MRLVELHIQNFRSIKKLDMQKLGDLNIFIGKNSSGKSNILEAINMFFADFAIAGGTTGGLTPYSWFNRDIAKPIDFVITVKIDDEECAQIFPAEILEPVKSSLGDAYRFIEIKRSILTVQGTWKTHSVSWANLTLVKDDKALTPQEIQQEWSKQSIEKASTMKVSNAGTEIAVSTAKGDLTLNITPQTLSTIQSKLVEQLKGRFKLISAIRDNRNPQPHRMTLLDTNVQSRIWTLEQSTNEPDEDKYSEIESSTRDVTKLRLDPAQGQLYIRRNKARFPLPFEGGGVQSITNLLFELISEKEKKLTFALEEPETHLHSEYQRNVFNHLKRISKTNQIFLATHSCIFVNKADLNYTWLVKLSGAETSVVPVTEMRDIIGELGVKPSDIFFANRIIFVEGPSDAIIARAYGEKIGHNFDDIDIIPIRGKQESKRALETWVSVTSGVIPIYLLLDADAKDDVEKLVKKGAVQAEQYHLWREGTIESYYPIDALLQALSDLDKEYELGLNLEEIAEKLEKGSLRADKITFGDKNRRFARFFKVLLAEKVAQTIATKDVAIPEEVRRELARAVGS